MDARSYIGSGREHTYGRFHRRPAAADHVALLDLALAQLPVDPFESKVIARADSAALTASSTPVGQPACASPSAMT